MWQEIAKPTDRLIHEYLLFLGATTHLFVEEDTVNKETKLQITNLEVEDKGSYTCRLSGSLGQTILIDVFGENPRLINCV